MIIKVYSLANLCARKQLVLQNWKSEYLKGVPFISPPHSEHGTKTSSPFLSRVTTFSSAKGASFFFFFFGFCLFLFDGFALTLAGSGTSALSQSHLSGLDPRKFQKLALASRTVHSRQGGSFSAFFKVGSEPLRSKYSIIGDEFC